MNKIPLIVLVGPTAVGKTEVSIQLAKLLDCEIVSVDSRLFYRGMDIGTAKPTPDERWRVPHHLIDVSDPDQVLNLSLFQRMAQDVIKDIDKRGKLPLLVGGTGQYIRAITENWIPPQVTPDNRLRDELEKMKDQHGNVWLHQKLASLDSIAANRIDARNGRRTIRALEVILTTGRMFSDQRGRSETPYYHAFIGLARPRSELYARIDARIEGMFAAGFLDEVRVLMTKGYSADMPSMSAIGYRECIKVLEGNWSVDQAKAEMRRATRVFVRRQANWFKETDPNIKWFYAGAPFISESIATIIQAMFKRERRLHPEN